MWLQFQTGLQNARHQRLQLSLSSPEDLRLGTEADWEMLIYGCEERLQMVHMFGHDYSKALRLAGAIRRLSLMQSVSRTCNAKAYEKIPRKLQQ